MSTAAAPPLEMDGAYIPPQQVVIASIYPLDCSTYISRRAPIQTFLVPRGTLEKPGILIVGDTWESDYAGQQRGIVNKRILAEHTADHIVKDLTEAIFEASASERAYPGIFKCKGPQPTADEIEYAAGTQHRFWLRLIAQARKFAVDKRHMDIQEKHRMAAREEGVTGEDWVQEISRDAMKKCSWCSEFIPAAARKCPKAGCGAFQTPEDAAAYAAMNGSTSQPKQSLPVQPQGR